MKVSIHSVSDVDAFGFGSFLEGGLKNLEAFLHQRYWSQSSQARFCREKKGEPL